MATVITVKAKIVELLQTLEGDGLDLKEVFNYIENQPKNFPSASVDIMETEETRLTSIENEVHAKFLIRVMIRDSNDATASANRISLINAITDLFRTSDNVDTLAGVVERMEVEKVTAFNANEDMIYIGFDLHLSTYFIKQFG